MKKLITASLVVTVLSGPAFALPAVELPLLTFPSDTATGAPITQTCANPSSTVLPCK